MSSSNLPPDARLDAGTVLDSLRDYLEQLREEGIEGLPGTLNPVRTEGKPLPLNAARPSRPVEMPERRLTLQRESVEQRTAAGVGVMPVRADTAQRMGGQAESGEDKARPVEAAMVADGHGAEEGSLSQLLYHYPGLEKTTNLDELRAFIGDCTRCKLAPMRTNLVFGVGNPNADLMFVGEAPGADEDARGEPFVGRAGQLLTDIIERGMGMTRDDVYICNVIKCRPPGNRNPENDEVASCEPFLFRQIDLVKPRAIVGLGTFAVQALLKIKTPISKLRGNWHEVRGVKLMPTFHPAYLLRNPGDKRLVWSDIQMVMKMLGIAIPNRGRT
jgi:uracil-DNA glycosylase family 4